MSDQPKKRLMKSTGLLSVVVPDGVSGRDVSAAVARMPSFDLPIENEVPSPVVAPGLHRLTKMVRRIRVDLLVDSPYQPRLRYDESKLSDLAGSLRGRQIEPLSVRALPGGKYEIISGHRRKRAAPLAQLDELDCIELDVSDAEARVLVLAANEPHEDFTDFERALAYQAVLDDRSTGGSVRTQKQLADKIGVSAQLVQRRLTMLKLPAIVIALLREYPHAFSSRWAPKLTELTSAPFDEKKLRCELVRVASGELQMSALFSVMASGRSASRPSASPQRGLSLQRGNKIFAQVTPNAAKRQVTVKLPGDCDIEEVAGIILNAIDQRFTSVSKT
jgi:ParB family chromosome partitioning protein